MKKTIAILTITVSVFVLLFGVITFYNVAKNQMAKYAFNNKQQSNITPYPSNSAQKDGTITDITDNDESFPLFPAYQLIEGKMRYGYIDLNGSFQIQPRYSYGSDFSNGVAIVSDDYITYQIIDNAGKLIKKLDTYLKPFHNGITFYAKYDNEQRYIGYLDTNGNAITEAKYLFADYFNNENEAYVSTEKGKYAKIDKSGNILEEFSLTSQYDNVVELRDGYVIYRGMNGKLGVVDLKGKRVLADQYLEIKYLGLDRFATTNPSIENNYEMIPLPMAIFNQTGTQLTDYVFYDLSEFSENYASATDDKYTFFIDKNGTPLSNLPKLEGRGTMQMLDGIIKAEIDQELFYLQKDGSILWKPDLNIYLDSGITLQRNKFKPNKYTLINYPQIIGLESKINEALINQVLIDSFLGHCSDPENFTDVDPAFEEILSSDEITFSAQLMKDLIMIEKTGYFYFFGAAHGMPSREYYHINKNTGDFYELKDLFKGNSDYVTTINKIIKKEIILRSKEENSMLFEDGFTSIAPDQYFYLKNNSLVIYFYPYEIAAYAGGFPEFEISFEDLKNIINYEGDLWRSFH